MRALLWLLVFGVLPLSAQVSPLLRTAEPDYGKYDELNSDYTVEKASLKLLVLADGTPFAIEETSVPLPLAVVDAVKEFRFKDQPTPFSIELSLQVRQPKRPEKLFATGANERLIKKRVQPVYPEDAKRRGVDGIVGLTLIITKQGGVSRLMVTRGPLMLIGAAYIAVKQWEFKPFTVDKEPIEVRTDVEIVFNRR